MAKDFDIAPCLLAKLILNYYFDIANRIENVEHSEQYSNINIYLRDTSLIQDMNMSYEIFLVSHKLNDACLLFYLLLVHTVWQFVQPFNRNYEKVKFVIMLYRINKHYISVH